MLQETFNKVEVKEMAKITIEELSDSLKDHLNGLGLTEAQVQELINLWADEKIGDVNTLNTTSETIVPAINEVKDSIDNKDLSAYQTKESNALLTNNKNIVDAINEVFQSQDTYKQNLVANLVNKGLEATTDMSFEELIENINNIQTGVVPAGDAVSSNVLKGKTFINNTGELLTGTMTNQGSKTITPSAKSQTLSSGYYSGITINGDSNLIASNIMYGRTIFGVTGTFYYPSKTESRYESITLNSNGYYEKSYYPPSLGKPVSSVTFKCKSLTIKGPDGDIVDSWSGTNTSNIYTNHSGNFYLAGTGSDATCRYPTFSGSYLSLTYGLLNNYDDSYFANYEIIVSFDLIWKA
jgi:hypothetical protein